MPLIKRLKEFASKYSYPLSGVLLEAVAVLSDKDDEIASLKVKLAEQNKGYQGYVSDLKAQVSIRDKTITKLIDDALKAEKQLAEFKKELPKFIAQFSRHVGGDGDFWLHELEYYYEGWLLNRSMKRKSDG
jgi:hypothetical protein